MKQTSLVSLLVLTTFGSSTAFVFSVNQPSCEAQHVLFAIKGHPETVSPVPVHYKHTVEALEKALKEQRESLKKIEMLAARLRDMEARHPHLSSAASHSNPRLLEAIHDVKIAMDHHGVSSPDTKRAWTKVETLLGENQGHVKSEFSSSTMSSAAFSKDGGAQSDRYAESALAHHHDYQAVLDPELLQDSMESIEKLLAFEHFVAVEKRLLDKQL